MKKALVGGVLGALLVLLVGGAVLLGTQLSEGEGDQQGPSEAEESTPAGTEESSPSVSDQQTSNDQERREFLRDCRNEVDTGGDVDCQCLVDAVEAQVPDPSVLTVADYAKEAANESVLAGCLTGL
jgi:hypothetical protein